MYESFIPVAIIGICAFVFHVVLTKNVGSGTQVKPAIPDTKDVITRKAYYKANGFTLVELLIVIVVIAVLATITSVAYTSIQGRAKDAQRMQDMNTISKALEVYKIANGSYPATVSTALAWGWELSHNGTDATGFLSALTGGDTGVSSVPVDPANKALSAGMGQFRDPTGNNENWVYYYYRYTAGAAGCDASRGDFYVLGVARMDTVPRGATHPQSPGFRCQGGQDWSTRSAWVTGSFVK